MADAPKPKKSEMLEVRIPHPTKAAFMDKAHAEGRPASEIVRESIERYLTEDARLSPSVTRPVRNLGGRIKAIALLIVAAIGLVSTGIAISPANAQPNLKAAFAALDANGDGAISRAEFIDPARAASTDIAAAQAVPAGGLAVAGPVAAGTPVYVRYVLDTGTTDGMLPLLIAVSAPAGATSPGDVQGLTARAFDRLDRNGDGRLSSAEFGAGG